MTLRMGSTTAVRLSDPEASDPALSGGKAAVLSRLSAEAYPVPPGFVVPWPALEPMLLAGGPDGNGVAAREAVARALADLGDVPLAVRSSGVAEDLADASFAGQYETVLGVRGLDAVLEAIWRCIRSADSERVRTYGERRADGASGPMAVLVQRLIEADTAGVAFSANPVTGDDEVVVNAVRGLGERLVSGEATPDEWIVRGSEVECRSAPEGAIDERDVRRVADLAKRLEATLGAPQDVEWAIADGELHLLQSRPITALPVQPEFEEPSPGYWMKDDTHYPMPLTPFGASVYLPALDAGFAPLFEEYGLLVEGMEQRSLGGEVYMRMIPLGGKDRKAPPGWVMWLAVRLAPPIRRRARAAAEAINTGEMWQIVERWNARDRDAFRAETAAMLSRHLPSMSTEGFLAHVEAAQDLIVRGENTHFRIWIAYGAALYDLETACRELLGWDAVETMSLVTGNSEASSAPGRALTRLAEVAGASPAARAVIEDGGADVRERLRAAAPDAADAFDGYLAEHGHRTLSYDPGDPTLAERPELVAGLLRDRLRGGAFAEAGTADRAREEAQARAREALAQAAPADRERFEAALSVALRAYPLREDNVVWTDNVPSAILHYSGMEFGRRLAAQGRLAGPADAMFLKLGELREALQDNSGGDLRAKVARRRAERAWVAAHPGPASYGPDPGPPPDLSPLQPGLRYVMGVLMWFMELMSPKPPESGEGELAGVPGSPGRHTGTVRVIRDESEFGRLRPGDVLVCPITSPAWSVLFSQAGAVVTDGGGVLSHAAVIAREYGIPAVMATGDATRRLHDGQIIVVDGTAGVVRLGGSEI